MKTPKYYIATHSGNFHTDDILSTAILHTIYPKYTVIRSRDPNIINNATIAYDVGQIYDHIQQRYDHHMSNPPLRGPNAPYSAAGLIWRHYAENYLQTILPHATSYHQDIIDHITNTWIILIDAEDNGYGNGPHSPIYTLVQHMRPITEQPNNDFGDSYEKIYQEHFNRLIPIVQTMFRHACIETYHQLFIKQYIQHTINEQQNNIQQYHTIISEHQINDHSLLSNTPICFIIYPREPNNPRTEWGINCVSPPNNPWNQKIPLPHRWRGLSNEALQHASNIPGAIFIHHRQFFGIAKDKESALTIIQQAIKDNTDK